MAKKYYLASVSWNLDQNFPTGKPGGFVWKASRVLYFRMEEPPTYGLIFKLALKKGASKEAFRVDALSELPDNFRQPWTDVDVFDDSTDI
ncbi:MAG: hypothetical protein H6560_04290 [Lewinellaceae bacterium]|nr:hypothetical protein [Lewinellaceae bacterium]